jgi:hypothetical protein
VETSRKESVRSNVPSLLNQKQLRDQSSSYFLQEAPDDEFDREFDAMMRFQRSIFDDFL